MTEDKRDDYTEAHEALRYLTHATVAITLVALALATTGAFVIRIARWALGW